MHGPYEPLLAYLDPGTGSLVVQVIVAAILSVGIFFRQAIFAPWTLLSGGSTEPRTDETAARPPAAESREPAETGANSR